MLPIIEINLPSQPLQGGNVPAFLAKLWKMVDNPNEDNLICWSEDGGSFIIKNQGNFTKTLLPYYYKHSNMASFVRQLNMYGFHKVTSVEGGGLKGDNEVVEFSHPYFMRGQEHLLDQIKRKINTGGGRGGGGGVSHQFVPSIKSEKVTEVLSEVGALKERQEEIDNKLDSMRSENEALWGEVLSLRQKHSQQQKIVNKLIQFLSALLQPRGMKRSFGRGTVGAQLAIEDVGAGDHGHVSSATPAKQHKMSDTSSAVIQEIPSNIDTNQLNSVLSNLSRSNNQTVNNYSSEPMVEIIMDAPVIQSNTQTQQQQESVSKYTMVDPVSVNSSLVKRPVLQRELSREDFDNVILNNERDLDSLKDILSGQITLDSSLVTSLFSSDNDANSLLFNDYNLLQDNNDDTSTTSDVKSVTYNNTTPSFFEMADEGDSDNILQGSGDKFFSDATVLHTPLVQEDQTNPLAKLFKNK